MDSGQLDHSITEGKLDFSIQKAPFLIPSPKDLCSKMI